MRRAVRTLALGCRTQPTPPAEAAARSASPVASATLDATAPTPRPTPREVVEAWNSAHERHDVKALESLYAPRVDFYGKSLSGHECAERKKAAFAKDPDYTQSIRGE